MTLYSNDGRLLQNLLQPNLGGEFLELSVGLAAPLKAMLGDLFCFDQMGDNRFEMGRVNAPLLGLMKAAKEQRVCVINAFDYFSNGQPIYALTPVDKAESLAKFLLDDHSLSPNDNQVGWFDWEHTAVVFTESQPLHVLMQRCGLNFDAGNCPRVNLDMEYDPLPGACGESIKGDLQILADGLGRSMHFEYNQGTQVVDAEPLIA